MAAFAALTLGITLPAVAAEEDRGGPADRLERLERRLNELAQRQEQFMKRLGPMLERREQAAPAGRENLRPGKPFPDREGMSPPAPPIGREKIRRSLPAEGPFAPGAAKALHDIHGLVTLCIFGAIIFNILLAIWIFTDIRKRGEGSGIFIALALVAGIPAAIIYSLVRIGDKKPQP
jgi:hypothetical protein